MTVLSSVICLPLRPSTFAVLPSQLWLALKLHLDRFFRKGHFLRPPFLVLVALPFLGRFLLFDFSVLSFPSVGGVASLRWFHNVSFPRVSSPLFLLFVFEFSCRCLFPLWKRKERQRFFKFPIGPDDSAEPFLVVLSPPELPSSMRREEELFEGSFLRSAPGSLRTRSSTLPPPHLPSRLRDKKERRVALTRHPHSRSLPCPS